MYALELAVAKYQPSNRYSSTCIQAYINDNVLKSDKSSYNYNAYHNIKKTRN